ncbi:hypothetical protein J4Q44_G00035030 [Coregonus suidteri]|uniref:Uncharacterized protein n=1 Tax=Coregonus suidteri TaxID=861788 RepID=A0AAN8MLK6_9TELE
MTFTDSTGSSHKFLMEASLLYQDICPEQSRFLMGRHQRMKAPAKLQPVPEDELCPFCFQWRRPDNHHIRLHPKRRASLRVQSVLRREARGKRLSLAQMDILRRFRGSSSVLLKPACRCLRYASVSILKGNDACWSPRDKVSTAASLAWLSAAQGGLGGDGDGRGWG